ncbi:MAG: tRNA-(ms[2]io[6]A)-hydroxylase [Planctomycetota bacterium]|nr:tRNA-(ms[2]io[6]A)-hydroxylase [Planctomycetota bacterium]MEE3218756.1 tRNA-(ms[2]io[6]A)-hydroxylase [Planctomycetota bacterium]
MLNLKSATSSQWIQRIAANVDELLIDHAHCEKKAAATALNLIFAYVENDELCREMELIVNEELEHFRMVLELLKLREVRFRRIKPSSYGRRLNELVRRQEPQRGVDRLLVAGLIEARSCERFALLRDHLAEEELASFYAGLFESEARHHATYVRLAKQFDAERNVLDRLDWLAQQEAEIINFGDPCVRMHS